IDSSDAFQCLRLARRISVAPGDLYDTLIILECLLLPPGLAVKLTQDGEGDGLAANVARLLHERLGALHTIQRVEHPGLIAVDLCLIEEQQRKPWLVIEIDQRLACTLIVLKGERLLAGLPGDL